MKKRIIILSFFLVSATALYAGNGQYVAFEPAAGSVCLSAGGHTAGILVDPADWAGVVRAAADLSADIGRVTGRTPALLRQTALRPRSVIVGTIGKSQLIDRLIAGGQLRVDSIRGRWESFVIQTVGGSLVVAGSDKRGTIYGIYDISEKIGVSPWYWWADVPVVRRTALYVREGRYVQPSPKVKYRGIFINDEEPSLGTWCRNRFGGYNSKLYCRVFELLLRLKANYLWPAMWNARFNEDDPENPRLADEYGIVMGTSHHEPMMRAHKEYTTRRDRIGPWDYAVNKARIDSFFCEGLRRNSGYENLITIGMRGDGDVAMGSGDDGENMRTLGKVIEGQRRIISDVYGKKPQEIPQLWAVFTEVQRYYDAGFTVPDDVTLLFCDNNWGYIRRTGPPAERNRKGGMGLYYHIDMNGGPWNDRWINTSPIPKLREQLALAYHTGLDRIWIVNVGDLKPKELPIDFILRYAWNPDAVKPGEERAFVRRWAAGIFGEALADDVADILSSYPKYNLWRKPEVQVPGIFSVEHYGEAERLTRLWQELADKAESVKARVPEAAQDAYFQLVYYPAVASAAVAGIYLAATQNRYYAGRRDLRANAFADRAKELFAKDSLLTVYYNKQLAGGKWDGMMLDRHIGYQKWSMPDRNTLPPLTYVVPDEALPAQPLTDVISDEYAIEAPRYDRSVAAGGAEWTLLPDLGRSDGCMGIQPVTAGSAENGDGARLEYDIDIRKAGDVTIALGLLPTQDIRPERGLRIGIALDDGGVVVLDARRGLVDTFDEYTPANLARSSKLKPLPPRSQLALAGVGKPMRNEVFDNLRWLDVTFPAVSPGRHTLKVVMVDPEVVLERIVVHPDNRYPSYFGPPVAQ